MGSSSSDDSKKIFQTPEYAIQLSEQMDRCSLSQNIVRDSNVISSIADIVRPSNEQKKPEEGTITDEMKELIKNIDQMNVSNSEGSLLLQQGLPEIVSSQNKGYEHEPVKKYCILQFLVEQMDRSVWNFDQPNLGNSNGSGLQHGLSHIASSSNQGYHHGSAMGRFIRNVDQLGASNSNGSELQQALLPVVRSGSQVRQNGQVHDWLTYSVNDNAMEDDAIDSTPPTSRNGFQGYLDQAGFLSISRESMELLQSPYANQASVVVRRGFILNNRNSVVYRRMQRRNGASERSQIHPTLSDRRSPVVRSFICNGRFVNPLLAARRMDIHSRTRNNHNG